MVRHNQVPFENTVNEIDPNEITVAKQVGSGYYSDVFKGTWGPANVPVAIKKYKKHVTTDQAWVEIRRVAKLEHHNIVGFIGYLKMEQSSSPALVTEWVPLGNLRNFLVRCRKLGLRGEKMISIISGIADGMAYMHGRNVVHGDLAARNCLIGHGLEVKIADLGHYDSRVDGKGVPAQFNKDPTKELNSGGFTPLAWWSPENLRGKKGTKRTAKGDVWAYGCLVYEVWTLGRGPFQPLWGSHQDVIEAILKGAKPTSFGGLHMRAGVRHVMDSCWQKEAGNRPDFEQIAAKLHKLPV